jgi:hypothetical protein
METLIYIDPPAVNGKPIEGTLDDYRRARRPSNRSARGSARRALAALSSRAQRR